MPAFSRSRRWLLAVPLLIMMLASAGCGQKGPLYLPEPEGDAAAPQAAAQPPEEAGEPVDEDLEDGLDEGIDQGESNGLGPASPAGSW